MLNKEILGKVCAVMFFTIEGIVYVASTTVDPHRHRHIEGYCNPNPNLL